MDEHEFKNLLEKYHEGTLSPKEKKLVDDWLDSLGNDNVQQLWSVDDRQNLKRKIFTQIKTEEQSILVPSVSQESGGLWYRAAAAILLLATLSYFVWQYASTGSLTGVEMLQASASGNEVNKVILADGSIVWLKGNSTLNYPDKFTGSERNVVLTGEALFEVAKDPEHPFIISCGNLTATVLGTSFNIKATETNIEVLVLTGKVSLSSATTNQKIIVLPNEKALFNNADEQLAKVEAPKEESVQAITRTEYSMNFKATKIDEVIRRIEGKFNVDVSMDDKRMGNCMITIDLTDQSLDLTLATASQILGFTYEIENDKIKIYGNGCE